MIRTSGLHATILRPWYVLGQDSTGRISFYWMARQIPASRAEAIRLGLLTLTKMISALAASVALPADGIRIVEVSEIASRRTSNWFLATDLCRQPLPRNQERIRARAGV
ncbi:MAG: hypothetical protein AUG46_09660 [Acidobacteria bacterium 13_1_20CM_3_58_11]|nr:MAG: hypothetical protein AUG46_09660 [Acidobacteria bacterium 13_1_20CM_3_58_11]